jgi:hypothetical protein
MVRREFLNRSLNEVPEVPLSEQVIGSRRRILELQWTIFVLPVSLDSLEENERIT